VKCKPLGSDGSITVRDVVNTVGSVCLSPHFADLAPNYPAFSEQARQLRENTDR
jgi:hypothetical protein